MNINRKVVEIELCGKKMNMILDFESAIYYQENTKESIFKGVSRIGKDMDVIAFAYLIASTLRDEEDKIVGIDFVKKLDLMSSVDLFMDKLGDLMENSLPVNDPKKKKK